MKHAIMVGQRVPTPKEVQLAKEAGYDLVWGSNVNGFDAVAVRKMLKEHNPEMVVTSSVLIAAEAFKLQMTVGNFQQERKKDEVIYASSKLFVVSV